MAVIFCSELIYLYKIKEDKIENLYLKRWEIERKYYILNNNIY